VTPPCEDHPSSEETRWYDSAWDLTPESWPTEDLFVSLPFLRLQEDCCGEQFDFRYAVRFLGGRPVAGAALHRLALSGHKLLPYSNNRWHGVLRQIIDRVGLALWTCGSIFIGGPSGYWIDGSFGEGGRWLARCMHTVQAESERPGRTVSVMKDMPVEHEDVAHAVCEEGFRLTVNEPCMVLDFDPSWTSEEDYVAALKARYRSEHRRTRAAFEGLERRPLSGDDIRARAERVDWLYRQVVERAPIVPVHVNPSFLARLADDLGERSSVVGYFDDGELVAFNTRLLANDRYESYLFGMDYALAKSHRLYKNILFDDLADALARGYPRIDWGRCALESKSALGSRPVFYPSGVRLPSRLFTRGLVRVSERIGHTTWVQRHPFRDDARPAPVALRA
jgi:hypothetical protein